MNKSVVRNAIPWTIVLVLCVAAVFSHRYAYERGKRQGGGEAAAEITNIEVPGDLQLVIALLSADDLSHLDKLPLYRARLRGLIVSAEGMVIPAETKQGHLDEVARLKELVKRGKEIDRRLAPPPSWWEDESEPDAHS